ncbi:hypothetical protein [Cellulomonas sp. C5510]|uniref:hypothetical protein n=1 Tax=Cellulomonas sp. C5510 TaxID=2871170 RepID=UPI001C97A463|nr:hypothetical protein [Cellulomonas sp. C5510]QZN85520.1 hypothetical protein K5O09_17525 [Cellulomonas sp. C5510]
MPDTRHPTDAQQIASAVDPGWVDAFVLEARLRDVPGERIGDALAEIDAHCRDSGEPAHVAFGDPAAYARTVAETFPTPRPRWWPHLAPLAVELAGMTTVITAVGEIARGGDVTLTWGHLAMLAVVAAGCGLLARGADRLLELIVRRPLVAAVAVGAGVTAALVPSALLLRIEAPIAHLPAPAALGAGLLLLATGVGADVVLGRRGRTADPVVGPREEAAPQRVSMLLPWTVLAWTAIGSVVVAVIGAGSGG